MSSEGNEEQILDDIERQLRTEYPELIDSFLAFTTSRHQSSRGIAGTSQPRVQATTTQTKGRTHRLARAGAAELVLLAISFTAFAVFVAALVCVA
jgi:hypothetical protein